jgi:hypothetical protein
MHCHGTHARCKNIFFQNMVRTDPYWQQAPFAVATGKSVFLTTGSICRGCKSGSWEGSRGVHFWKSSNRSELELMHFQTEPNSSGRSSGIVREEVREICLRNRNRQIWPSQKKKFFFLNKRYTACCAARLYVNKPHEQFANSGKMFELDELELFPKSLRTVRFANCSTHL